MGDPSPAGEVSDQQRRYNHWIGWVFVSVCVCVCVCVCMCVCARARVSMCVCVSTWQTEGLQGTDHTKHLSAANGLHLSCVIVGSQELDDLASRDNDLLCLRTGEVTEDGIRNGLSLLQRYVVEMHRPDHLCAFVVVFGLACSFYSQACPEPLRLTT